MAQKKYKVKGSKDNKAIIPHISGEIKDIAEYIVDTKDLQKDNRFSDEDFALNVPKKEIQKNDKDEEKEEEIFEESSNELKDIAYNADVYQPPEGEPEYAEYTYTEERKNNRVAVMNLDWNHTKASDIYMVLASFIPEGGKLEEVKIYQSDFGHKRLLTEKTQGPPLAEYIKEARRKMAGRICGKIFSNIIELESSSGKKVKNSGKQNAISSLEEAAETQEQYEKKIKDKVIELRKASKKKLSLKQLLQNDELVDTVISRESLTEEAADQAVRNYELDRLRYYYGVAIFDSGKTANAVYSSVNGLDFERSGLQMDLRFIDDDISFKDKDIWDIEDPENGYLHDLCNSEPTRYEVKDDFESSAVQKLKNVKLDWDTTDSNRTRITKKKTYSDEEVQKLEEEGVFKDLLAENDPEANEDEIEGDNEKKKMDKERQKEIALLLGKEMPEENESGNYEESTSDNDNEDDGFKKSKNKRKNNNNNKLEKEEGSDNEDENDEKYFEKNEAKTGKKKDFIINFTSIVDKETIEKLNQKAKEGKQKDKKGLKEEENSDEDSEDIIVFTKKTINEDNIKESLTPFQKVIRERQEANLNKSIPAGSNKKLKVYDEYAAIEKKVKMIQRKDSQINIFKDAAGAENFIIEADVHDDENENNEVIGEKEPDAKEQNKKNSYAGEYNAVVMRQVSKLKDKIEDASSNEKGKRNPKLRRKLQKKLDELYKANPWLSAGNKISKEEVLRDERFAEVFNDADFAVDHSDKNYNSYVLEKKAMD